MRHIRRRNFDFEGIGMIPETARSHPSNRTEFDYLDEGTFCSSDSYKYQSKYSISDLQVMLRDMLSLNYQEYYIFQQRFYQPSMPLEVIARALGVTKQRVNTIIKKIKKNMRPIINENLVE